MTSNPTDAAVEPAPRPRRRGALHAAFRIFQAVLAVVGIALLIYIIALPGVVKRVVRSALADLGFPAAVFEVRTATLWAVELADVRPGGGAEGEGVIRRAMVRYSPVEVFKGKLRTIEVTGAEVPFVIQRGQMRFALAPKRPAGDRESGTAANPQRMPFDRLEVVASTLRVQWEGREIQLPISGTVHPTDAGANVELSTFFQGTTIPIAGSVNNAGTAVDLTASVTNLNVAGARAVIPWALMSYPFQTSGRVDARMTYRLAEGKSLARLHVEPKNVWVAAQPGEHQLAVQRVDGALDVELGTGAAIESVGGTIRVGKVAWDDLAGEAIELAVRGRGNEALEVEGRLQSEGWRLSGLRAKVNGWTGSGEAVGVAASFEARGGIPARVAKELTRSGIITEDLGQLGLKAEGLLSIRDGKWAAEFPKLEVAVDPGAVELRKQGITFAGVAAEAKLRGSATAAGGRLEILPGSSFDAGSLRGPGWSVRPLDAKAGVLDVGVAGEPVAITYQPADSNAPWRVALPAIRVAVSKATVDERASRTNVRGMAGVLNVGGELTREKVSMVALADSSVGFDALEIGGGVSAVRAGAAKLAILPAGESSPLVNNSRLSARLRSAGEVRVDLAGQTRALAKGLEVVGMADLSVAGSPALVADVHVTGGQVSQGKTWGLSDIAAVVPVAWNAVGEEEGSFTVGKVTVGDQAFPAVKGTVSLVDKTVAVTAETEVAKGAKVKADAEVEWTATGIRGRAATTMPAVRLADGKELARVWPGAGDIELTGTISAGGEVVFNGPLIKPKFTAIVSGGRLASKEYDLVVEGINGGVTIDNLDPLSGPGLQRLRVEKLHLGKWDLTRGAVEFRIERADSLHIERSRWSWVGGQIYTYDLRLNPAKPLTFNAVVYADKLDLRHLLGVLAQGEATGRGLLYGRLPVRLNWPEISFGDGFLYATGAGGIEVGRQADVVEKLLDQSGWGQSDDANVKEIKTRIVQALRNFNYDTLKVDFIQRNGGLTASIQVVGKGGTGPTAQELNLTVNLNGIDQVLNQVLVIRKVLGAMGGQ